MTRQLSDFNAVFTINRIKPGRPLLALAVIAEMVVADDCIWTNRGLL